MYLVTQEKMKKIIFFFRYFSYSSLG